ncbi:methyltransferase domain-containing protein [candidate division KSB1 bacterium]|nr:methyltransferase domain-containing protein [candidate division KSB1 bacterium]
MVESMQQIRKTTSHKLWDQYQADANYRGKLVLYLLKKKIHLQNSRIIDAGCGSGKIAALLTSQGARVDAYDPFIRPELLKKIDSGICFHPVGVDAAHIKAGVYDAALLVDVIEHIQNPAKAMSMICRSLKTGGWLYLSTPNRLAFLNILCDPHYSLPFVALLKRKSLKTLLSSWLQVTEPDKQDHAELFSLDQLDRLLKQNSLQWKFVNQAALTFAQQQPHSIWNRNWHLKIIQILNTIGLYSKLLNLVDDSNGAFNRFINPTWFIMAQKT